MKNDGNYRSTSMGISELGIIMLLSVATPFVFMEYIGHKTLERSSQQRLQVYRQADNNNNGVLEESEATGLFKVLMENKYPLSIGELEKKGFPGLDQQDFEHYLKQQK